MNKPQRVDDALYAHFLTFSCYHRRRWLDHDQAKRILLGVLNEELISSEARCVGFVIMPDHVHAMIQFSRTGQLSRFVQLWKSRSSKLIKKFAYQSLPEYTAEFPKSDPLWQVRFYSFEVYSAAKMEEKLNYMHLNPVRAGLVEAPINGNGVPLAGILNHGQSESRFIGSIERNLLLLRNPDVPQDVWVTPVDRNAVKE